MKGRVKIGRKTKQLVQRLSPGDIAVINHQDLDELAANSLIRCKVRAVINLEQSISGRYPNQGPSQLIQAGILLADAQREEINASLKEGDLVEIRGGELLRGEKKVASLEVYDREQVKARLEKAAANLEYELDNFIENTLYFARKEKSLLLGTRIPPVSCPINGRHALVVVRGRDYRADLQALESYIREVKPVIIAVDGGADACLEFGYYPDIIIGDMDSISDRALNSGADIIVHAYSDGRAPGLERVRELGLQATTLPAPGLSEDIAMLLAYEQGADLIVAVGTHNNIIDFLEKGRPGMGSTLLVRMKIGSRLIDAKGVNKLYQSKVSTLQWCQLVVAAFLPILVVLLVSPSTRQFLHLCYLQLMVMFQNYFR
ncbi:MAG: putative cytokinetic ring protein SteA [Halanaerobium sp.]|nr:putative cytokinetic ring protein SteA [Halanaerobium sp.]